MQKRQKWHFAHNHLKLGGKGETNLSSQYKTYVSQFPCLQELVLGDIPMNQSTATNVQSQISWELFKVGTTI